MAAVNMDHCKVAELGPSDWQETLAGQLLTYCRVTAGSLLLTGVEDMCCNLLVHAEHVDWWCEDLAQLLIHNDFPLVLGVLQSSATKASGGGPSVTALQTTQWPMRRSHSRCHSQTAMMTTTRA